MLKENSVPLCCPPPALRSGCTTPFNRQVNWGSEALNLGLWVIPNWKKIWTPGVPSARAGRISPVMSRRSQGNDQGFLFLCVLQNTRCIAFQGRSGWEARLFLPSLGTLAPGPWPRAESGVPAKHCKTGKNLRTQKHKRCG